MSSSLPQPFPPEDAAHASPYESPRKIMVILFFLILLIGSPVASAVMERMENSSPPASAQPETPQTQLKLQGTTLTALAIYSGFIVAGAVFCLTTVFHETRTAGARGLLKFLQPKWRPVPCLKITDGLAAFMLFIAAQAILVAVLLSVGKERMKTLSPGQLILLHTVLNVLLISIPCLFLFLRARLAGGKDGAAGLWPFWKATGLQPESNIPGDLWLGFKTYAFSAWILWLLAVLNIQLVEFISGGRAAQNPMLEQLKSGASSPESPLILPLLFLASVVVAPMTEELLFRGGMYNITARHFGRVGGAIITSTVFAMAHQVPSNTWPLCFMSLTFIWLYERTGRLLAPMAMHAMNNLLVTVLTVLVGPGVN